MHPIPIDEDAIRPYIGKSVCAVLQDGTCYYGSITDVRGGQLFLDGGYKGVETLSTSVNKAKTQLSKLNDKAAVSAFFPGFGFGGGGLALSLLLIALLFATPFVGFPFF